MYCRGLKMVVWAGIAHLELLLDHKKRAGIRAKLAIIGPGRKLRNAAILSP
jgi:hypothetical protein